MSAPGASAPAVRAFVGLGANLGDAAATVRAALDALSRLPDTTLAAASSLYRSAPVDAAGPDFINAVAALDTALPADALLTQLQTLELQFGRERPYRNAPRTLDLDLLLYGEVQQHGERLILPHPRLAQRAFVLLPLLELAPDLRLPDGRPLQADVAGVADQPIARMPG